MTATSAQKQDAAATMLITHWEQIGGKIASLAEAFPEEKYESKPVDTVRAFGDVLRHIAFWNQYVADAASGRKADDTANELPAAEYRTKARIVNALKRSTEAAAIALKTHQSTLDAKTAELVVSFIEHNCEH